LGTLLHFLFEWSGENRVVGLFSAVNESIWEHMKLLYYPALLVGVVEYAFWGGEVEQFWCVKLAGLLFGLALIPVLYYTYTGTLGVEKDWFNITIFFLAAGTAFWLETKLFHKPFFCSGKEKYAVASIILWIILFTLFTFYPPHIPFFRDPLTQSYGYFQRRSHLQNLVDMV
jgi:hypothetical protein